MRTAVDSLVRMVQRTDPDYTKETKGKDEFQASLGYRARP